MEARVLRAIRFKRLPIFQQLCIEEALFYRTDDNWLLFNEGSLRGPPTVVLGISGKPEKMCNLDLVQRDKVPLIKRFSGGGTVIVDQNTVFSTLIMNQASVRTLSYQYVYSSICADSQYTWLWA
ncbi:unnamed protein product [Choristocarpus tenellus]